MDEFFGAEQTFRTAVERAKSLCALQQYMAENHAAILDTSDMLRAAVVQGISALDFLLHEVNRIETMRRLKSKKTIKKIDVPLQLLNIEQEHQYAQVEEHVKRKSSYKTFVDPNKMGEMLSCFIEHPWQQIAIAIGEDEKALKTRLSFIYRWRNRIAHEADVNPAYASVGLFPIDCDDVESALSDILLIGDAVVETLRLSD
jgi:hypothetical protein